MQIFPRWSNKIPLAVAAGLPLALVALIGGMWYWMSPKFTDAGYSPKQPIAYSHKLHAGQLGIDCLYCHGNAEKGQHANIPATQVCMNCHTHVKTESAALEPLRESWKNDVPVEWVRIHKIPDFAMFPHNAHLNAGVGCVECHGRIDQMTQVRQEKPLNMGWCLDCHRDPESHLRPKELITKMDYKPTEEQVAYAHSKAQQVNPPQYCSGCHR